MSSKSEMDFGDNLPEKVLQKNFFFQSVLPKKKNSEKVKLIINNFTYCNTHATTN